MTDRLPRDPSVTNLVLAPHEFFLLHDAGDAELNEAAALSVPITTEQPGTQWFFIGLSFCRAAPLVLDINVNGVSELRRLGVAAERLALGGVPSMRSASVERDIDVLFLGGDTVRRGAVLSTLGPLLWNRRADLRLFRFTEPVHGGVPGLVFGQDKYDLLARTRMLVNVHRDDSSPGYFEWARMIEAMANGATVITEPSTGFEPLVPGEHFVQTDDIAGAVSELLDDEPQRHELGEAGRRAVLDAVPLTGSLGPVLDRLDGWTSADERRVSAAGSGATASLGSTVAR